MARVPPLHPTKFAVSAPKNLRLPRNLKAETTTSCRTSRKASPGVSIDRSFTVTIPLHSPCSRLLPETGASISTSIKQITPQITPRTMPGLRSPFASSNFKFFNKNRSGERLKYHRERVIFHESLASLTCLLSGLLATNHRTTPPAHPTTTPAPPPTTPCGPRSYTLLLFLRFNILSPQSILLQTVDDPQIFHSISLPRTRPPLCHI